MTLASESHTSTATPVRAFKQFIGGEWVDAVGGATFESLNPLDGTVFATAPASTRADTAAAIAAAHAAQPGWAAVSPGDKQKLFLRAADLLEERGPDLVARLAEETGAGFAFSWYQITWSAQLLRLASGWVYEPKGKIVHTDFPHTVATTERKPLGVVASITPWNGANLLAWRAVVVPLAAGNTVVVKPSEESPYTAGVAIAEVLHDAGFPPGTINVVTHAGKDAADVSEEFYSNPAVRCIFFTGSAATGRKVAASAGAALKKSILELGGYNHIVVLDDADLDHAAKIAAFSSFFHQGQVCMASSRILVQSSVYDAFLEKFKAVTETLPIGDPADQNTIVGPLINARALQGVKARVASAVSAGGRIVTGGNHNGPLFEPTILVDVPDDNDASCEETFGPVTVVRPVETDEEAISLANASPYGLSFAVVTGDTARGKAMTSRIECGAVHVNTPTINDEPHLPNGGMKGSGWGRSGVEALDDFTEIQWTTVELETRALPL
ncbi:aldehyde dehydrogenase family protein [Kribbella sp. NPDC051620]|uniref:aldehyde dehydrogenase family protein n=1 Tax=Kribbella sp. NPDC051620 TaxID=3364120 RepID=UPI00379D9BB6